MSNNNFSSRIRNKIKDSELDDPIKGFLLDALNYEYENFEDKKSRFSKEYDRLIKRHLDESGDNK